MPLGIFEFFRKSRSLLGMNARNLLYVAQYNSPAAISLANNKLRTNLALEAAGIPTPRRIAVIKHSRQLKTIDWASVPNSIVIKPRKGFGGEGVMLLYGRLKNGNWVRADKKPVTVEDVQNHILNILSGNHSKGGNPDWAIIEERLKISEVLKPYSYKGAPDVRVLVFNHVPVMAMLRLPTRESQGKSNLHQGGIGVGIDLATGKTTHALYRGKSVAFVPGTKVSLLGFQIPFWREILNMAVQCQDATGLGYFGADIILDRDRGPVVIEVNARPGLGIQSANAAGLKARLEKVKDLKVQSAAHGVRLAMDLFGGRVEEGFARASAKTVIGSVEHVVAFDAQGRKHELVAKIDTGAYRSSVDAELARTLGLQPEEGRIKTIRSSLGVAERPLAPLTYVLAGVRRETMVTIADRHELKFDMIIGRRDLKGFLVDPAKRKSSVG